MVWLYSILSVVIISLVSFVGALTFAIKADRLKKILIYFVAFSTGALLGGAFFHLFPEVVEETGGFGSEIAIAIFISFLFFFVLEKFLRWHHCHDTDCGDHPKHIGGMNLVGDAFHNLIDGVLIAVSFLVSIPLGIATTTAVIVHEIPQELGDFGILLHSGMEKRRALFYNFLSACAAILGAIVALLIGEKIEAFTYFMVSFAAGGFLYIALSDLVPELHKEMKMKVILTQIFFIFLGAASMYLLLFIE